MTPHRILVSQRVDDVPAREERRDGLDQRWAALLAECRALPIPVANDPRLTPGYLELPNLAGILLTGGNDLNMLGGNVPEREATELSLLAAARRIALPVLGVCHGMQMIQSAFGITLQPVQGHVTSGQSIAIDGCQAVVNSFHRFGTTSTVDELEVWARSEDGVVKAVRHRAEPIVGIMWHPERILPFRHEDIELIRRTFRLR